MDFLPRDFRQQCFSLQFWLSGPVGISALNSRELFNQEGVQVWRNVASSFLFNSLITLSLRIVYWSLFHQSSEKDDQMNRLSRTPSSSLLYRASYNVRDFHLTTFIFIQSFALSSLYSIDDVYSTMFLSLTVTSDFTSSWRDQTFFFFISKLCFVVQWLQLVLTATSSSTGALGTALTWCCSHCFPFPFFLSSTIITCHILASS